MRHLILLLMIMLMLAVSVSFGQTTAPDYYESGIVRYKHLDYDGAIADFTLSIALDPRYDKAYNWRGIARVKKNDLDGAIADFKKAIELDPKEITAYSNLCNARSEQNDLDATIELKVGPKEQFFYYYRGNTLYKKEDYEGALADYTKAIELRPAYFPYYRLRAKAYRALKMKELADADEKTGR